MKAIKFAPASKIYTPSTQPSSTQASEIFVGGLSSSMTAEELKKEMSVFGAISTSRILYYRDGRPRGFGFVTFEADEVTQAIVEKKFINLSNCVVECKLAVSKVESKQLSEKAVLRKVIAEGLESLPEEELSNYFSKFGAVTKVRFAHKKNELKEVSLDTSKAIVTFKTEESAQCCIEHGSLHQILDSLISVTAASTNSVQSGAQGLSEAGTHYSASSSSRDIKKSPQSSEFSKQAPPQNTTSPSKISNAMREVLGSAYKHYSCAPNNIQFRFPRQNPAAKAAPVAAKSFRQIHREAQAAFMFDSR